MEPSLIHQQIAKALDNLRLSEIKCVSLKWNRINDENRNEITILSIGGSDSMFFSISDENIDAGCATTI